MADTIESGAERGLRGLLVRRVDRDPHERAHVRLDRFIAVSLCRFIPPEGGNYRTLEEVGQRGD